MSAPTDLPVEAVQPVQPVQHVRPGQPNQPAGQVRVPVAERLAGAPISWGVCEVPGWGYQLPAEVVLRQMRDAGLAATEFGPDGFLPEDPREKAATLASFGLRAVGGFVPVVLHVHGHDPVPGVDAALDSFVAAGAGVLVLAASSGRDGYDTRPTLSPAEWQRLLDNLDRLAALARSRGVLATIHPHVGTLVENRAEVARVLDGCGIGLTLDTGHLLIGGTDPVALAASATDRITHVHLKDVDAGLADQVRNGSLTYTDGVRDGLYRPLGHGDVDIAEIVATLEAAGYDGWYVMEQDTILTAEPPPGAGPDTDVRAGVEYLRGLA